MDDEQSVQGRWLTTINENAETGLVAVVVHDYQASLKFWMGEMTRESGRNHYFAGVFTKERNKNRGGRVWRSDQDTLFLLIPPSSQ